VAESGTRLDQPPGDPDANRRPPAPRAESPHAPGGGSPGYQGAPQAAPGGPGKGAGAGGARPKAPSGKLRWLLFILAIAAAAAVVWFLVPKGAQTPPQGGPGGFGRGGGGFGGGGRFGGAPTTVGMATVEVGQAPLYIDALGTVTPVANVVVRSQVSGQLQSIGFREGQMVTQGQFLAQIDPRPFQQQLAQAEGVLARDEAQLANARIQLQRYQTLLAQDSIARQDVDNQAATVRQLEGVIKSDQAAVGAQRLNLTYARVVAPVSGRVGLRRVDPGNYVTTGDANGIVVITQVAPIDVAFSIPEDNLQKVNARSRSGATLPVTAFDRAQKGELAKGALLTLDNAVDTATGTVRAKARFTNAGGELFPNQFVNIRLLVDTLQNALMIPSSAVLRGSQGLFVYVINQDRTVTVRAVTTGTVANDKTVILSGLQAGERVVTDGTDRLRDGARVILPGDCIPNMATGGGGARRGGGQGGPGGQGGFGGGQAGPGGFQGGPGGGQGAGFQGGQGGFRGGQGAGMGGGRAGAGGCPPGQVRAQSPVESAARAGQAAGVIPSSPQPMAPPAGASEATGVPAGRPGAQGQAGAPGGQRPQGAFGGQGQGGQGQPGQGQGGFGQGGQGGGGAMRMLDQLNLDAGQQAKVQAILAEARQKAAQQGGDDPAARGQAFRGAMQEAMGKITPILRPDQKAKFDELRAQQAQGGGFGGGRPGGGFGGFGGGRAPQGQ
jgi:multidrug efflux system membrane fusion protein